MTQRQLHELAQSRGLVCMGPTLAGAWDGWPFLATLRFGRKETLRAEFRLARTPAAAEVRQTELPAGCRLSLGRRELRLICTGAGEDLPELFRAGMDAAAGLLSAGSAALPERCALCGREEWDSFALVKGRYVPVHRDCCEDRHHRAEARAALSAGGGNYFTGWLGALAGGLLGLFPTVLTAWFWGMVSVWLCLCIPLGAYFGYKLCRGRMDRMAVAATVASSLVQVFLLDQIRYYQDFVAQGIFPLVFASVAHYFKTVPVEEMLLRVVEPLQFVTLGDVCALCIVDLVNWDRTLDADMMLDSLTERESAVAVGVWAAGQSAEPGAQRDESFEPEPTPDWWEWPEDEETEQTEEAEPAEAAAPPEGGETEKPAQEEQKQQ